MSYVVLTCMTVTLRFSLSLSLAGSVRPARRSVGLYVTGCGGVRGAVLARGGHREAPP